MKNLRKTLLLTLLLVVVLISAVFTITTFKDTKPSDWYMNTVSKLVERDGINGYPDGTFKPNDLITKAEFIKTVVASLGFTERTDAWPHWSSSYIEKATELNIIDTEDFPLATLDKTISWYDMAKVVVKTLKYNKEKFTEDFNSSVHRIKDFSSVPISYRDYVLKAYTKGIITGYPDGTFSGNRGLTRAEASTVIIRILEKEERVLPEGPAEKVGSEDSISINTFNTGLVREEDKPKDKIVVDLLKDASNPPVGSKLEDLPDCPLEYVIDGVTLDLRPDHEISNMTEILTAGDIKRLQSYGYNWHTGFVDEVPPDYELGEYYKKHPEWAGIVAKDYIPQKVNTFKYAMVGWITGPNLNYVTAKGYNGVRGVFQVNYSDKNPYSLESNKLYERDAEFRYANTT